VGIDISAVLACIIGQSAATWVEVFNRIWQLPRGAFEASSRREEKKGAGRNDPIGHITKINGS
jgi:hypothetical protein